jgi:hypothetical protein
MAFAPARGRIYFDRDHDRGYVYHADHDDHRGGDHFRR